MASLKTENLVILFTDIAGFTEATSLQSREQNRLLLDRHNGIMLPIVKRFGGRHIKSIGDALLLVFRSPTDAMRCAMAMQDALHAYNLNAKVDEQIHVRIAASLGEVRVTRNDIFGEPVNVTSRIEHITPADEIYFSEAVYLAMNKAEVPAVEVGIQELRGISKPVRIFAIPRFAQTRLVADQPPSVGAIDPSVSFPYGGMHLTEGTMASDSWMSKALDKGSRMTPSARIAAIAGALCVSSLALAFYLSSGEPVNRSSEPVRIAALGDAAETRSDSAAAGASERSAGSVTSPPDAKDAGSSGVDNEAASEARASLAPGLVVQAKPTQKSKPQITNIIQAKLAYKAGRIGKETYRTLVQRLESEYDSQVRKAKLDYKAGKFGKEEYRRRIIALKVRYIGES